MPPIAVALTIANVAAALLVIGLSLPCLFGRVPPNRWYGFRIPAAYRSDAHWYAIQRHGARGLILGGIVLLAVGLATPWLPFGPNDPGWILVACASLWLLVPVAGTLRFAVRYRPPERAGDDDGGDAA